MPEDSDKDNLKEEAGIAHKIKSKFNEKVDVSVDGEKRIIVRVKSKDTEDLVLIAQHIKSEGFDRLSLATANDLIDQGFFEMVYLIGPYPKNCVIMLKIKIPRETPELPTLIPVWESANLDERETHEMFGINFKGHPNTKHLVLDEDWPKGEYPLRKDFKMPD